MAIYCIFGLPGAGKTTMLTRIGLRCLAGKSTMGIPAHDRVYSNFELAGAYKLDFDTLGLFKYVDSLILIDEIMLLADSRNYKNFDEHLKYFFSHHRKMGVDVVYCSQSWENMDKRIRELTDKYYFLERGKLLDSFSFCKPIKHTFGVVCGKIVDSYTLGAPVTWSPCYRPRYYAHFDTYFGLRDLPPIDSELWAPAAPRVTFRERIRKAFRRFRRPERSDDTTEHARSI